MFGSSRQMARIADDGYLPELLTKRKNLIPVYAILAMALTASGLIVIGGLRLILEFGSITFLLVSLLMAMANFRIRKLTHSSTLLTVMAIFGLLTGAAFILGHEYQTKPEQLAFIVILYVVLALLAWGYAKMRARASSALQK